METMVTTVIMVTTVKKPSSSMKTKKYNQGVL